MIAEVIVVIPTIPFTRRASKDMTTDGADDEFPQVEVRIDGLAQLRGLLAFSVNDVLNKVKSLTVNQWLVLTLDILVRVIAIRGNKHISNIETVS